MASKVFILCLFAIVLLGMVVADDYDGEEGDGEGEGDQGGEGGGDYDSGDGGDGGYSGWPGGDYAAAPQQQTDDYNSAASHLDLVRMMNPEHLRHKRSPIGDQTAEDSERVLKRVRRGGHGRVGPVWTYQKTDHHANFKWGVKHKVGKHLG